MHNTNPNVMYICRQYYVQMFKSWSGLFKSIMKMKNKCVPSSSHIIDPFHLQIGVFVVRVGYLVSEQQNCRCVLSVIGKCMVWVGQVKVGRLSNGILLNIDNIPSKCLHQREIVSLNLVS